MIPIILPNSDALLVQAPSSIHPQPFSSVGQYSNLAVSDEVILNVNMLRSFEISESMLHSFLCIVGVARVWCRSVSVEQGGGRVLRHRTGSQSLFVGSEKKNGQRLYVVQMMDARQGKDGWGVCAKMPSRNGNDEDGGRVR